MFHKMGWPFQKVLYPQLTWARYTHKKVIYLTFDDGPIPDLTDYVLGVLREYNALATFFCVGENISKYPYILEQIVANNHAVGNHTYNHLNGWQNDDWHYLENIRLCQQRINDSGYHRERPLFRPPYGKIKYGQINLVEKKFEIIMWDVLSMDYSPNLDRHECLEKTIKHTENGSIVVFHDNLKAQKNLEFVLPRYLAHFSQQGYSFLAL